jgi:adhesin/invasin
VGANGGTVELIATVVGGPADSAGAGQGAQPLEGVAVTFGATKGVLGSATAFTNASGEARTTLTTTEETVVSATAGTKTATTVTVAVRPAASVSIACAVAGGATGSTCSSIQANISNNTAIVSLTVTKGAASSSLRSAVLDFGDGTSQSLGNLAAGAVTVSHSYQGPSDANPRNYVATVTVTDVNGETATASTNITVTPRSRQLNVALTATPRTAVLGVGQPVDFEATVTPATGGADMVQTYRWSFGDGSEEETTSNKITHVYTSNGVKTATVTVTTTDGRTATSTTQFITSGI